MKPRELAALLLLAAVWGASFLFIRIAAPVLGPFPLMFARVVLAAAALGALAALRKAPIQLAHYWRRLLVLGLIHAALPFVLIAAAEVHLSASMAAVLLAATPLMTALLSTVWLGEALTTRRIVGTLVGILGVAILMGWSPIPLNFATVLSIAAVLLASLAYAAGVLYSRKKLADAPVMTLALGQQLAAAVWLVVPAAITVPQATVTRGAIVSLLALALVSTAFAYLLLFWLIAQIGAIKTSTVTNIIPIFGVLWGTLLLDEPLSAGMLYGLACILASLVLVHQRAAAPSAREPQASAAGEEAA